MKGKLVNFRGSTELHEAIRTVAFKQGHSNNSRTIVEVLEKDPLIARELKIIKKKVNKN